MLEQEWHLSFDSTPQKTAPRYNMSEFSIETSKKDWIFVLYVVEFCTCIIPNVSNNVQTREIHKLRKEPDVNKTLKRYLTCELLCLSHISKCELGLRCVHHQQNETDCLIICVYSPQIHFYFSPLLGALLMSVKSSGSEQNLMRVLVFIPPESLHYVLFW